MDQNNKPQKTSFLSTGFGAFLTVAIIFIVLYYFFGKTTANALNGIWLIVTGFLLICLIISWFLRKKYFKQVIDELSFTDEELNEVLNNKDPEWTSIKKSIKKEARKRAKSTYPGEMGSYFWLFLVIFVFRAFVYEPFVIPSGSMEPTLTVGDYIGVSKYYYRLESPIKQKTLIEFHPVQRGDVIVFKSPADMRQDWIKRVIGLPGDLVHYDQVNRQVYILRSCQLPDQAARVLNENNSWSQPLPTGTAFDGCQKVPFSYSKYVTNKNFLYNNVPSVQRNETVTRNDGTTLTHRVLQYPQPLEYAARQGIFVQDGYPVLTWHVPAGHYFVMGDNRDNSEDSRFIGFIPYNNIVGKAQFIWYSIPHNQYGQSYGFWNLDWARMFTSIYNDNKPDINPKYNQNPDVLPLATNANIPLTIGQ